MTYKYVENNNRKIKYLKEINTSYQFLEIENCDLKYSYDSEINFQNVSTKDFLIYHLAYFKERILRSIQNAAFNRSLYHDYLSNIKNTLSVNPYQDPIPFIYKIFIKKCESKLIAINKIKPSLTFSVKVDLYLKNYYGHVCGYKRSTFTTEEIITLLNYVEQKDGDFFQNSKIWDSICRVERGRVSNKIRGKILERDHYRCVKCGCTNNLEIDHIIPIAKGGRSDYDNLQTLCHNCNLEKGCRID